MVKSPGFVLDDSSYNTHWPIRCVKLIGWGHIIHYNMLGAIHLLFIHYGDLYSAPSRLLLRSAPDPCTAKEKSFDSLPTQRRGGSLAQVDACRQGRAPCGRPHRKLEPTDIILSSSHAKKLAFSPQNFVGIKSGNFSSINL